MPFVQSRCAGGDGGSLLRERDARIFRLCSGGFFRRRLGRDFLVETGAMWKTWKSGPVWRTGTFGSRMNSGLGRGLHMRAGESTGGFEVGVGSVGKHGWVIHDEGMFSNCPEIHNRVLEKRTVAERCMDKGFEQVFQISSGTTGTTGNDFLLICKKA